MLVILTNIKINYYKTNISKLIPNKKSDAKFSITLRDIIKNYKFIISCNGCILLLLILG